MFPIALTKLQWVGNKNVCVFLHPAATDNNKTNLGVFVRERYVQLSIASWILHEILFVQNKIDPAEPVR